MEVIWELIPKESEIETERKKKTKTKKRGYFTGPGAGLFELMH